MGLWRLTRRECLVVVWLLLGAACTDVNVLPPTSPTPVVPPVTPKPADIIEYRVFGNVGQQTPAAVRYTNSVDGVTNLPSISLPYIVTVQSRENSIFLLVEATATPVVFVPGGGSLQVQIFVNGRLFREGFASGFSTLSASASGTWRRDATTSIE